MRRKLCALMLAVVLLVGCTQQAAPPAPPPQAQPPVPELTTPVPPPNLPASNNLVPLTNQYIQNVADSILADLIPPQADDFEKIRIVYRYLIETTLFAEPIGLDVWRIRGNPTQKPPYLENRALSPLLFGIGSCEDYAAALTILLQRMGFEAQYLPGLTISVEKTFVDHAWTVVKIQDKWYHLDCQLEDNITRNNLLTYHYFLKTDQQMLADHRFGESWLAYGGLDAQAQMQVREHFTPPPCVTEYQAPPPEKLPAHPAPNRAELGAALEQEKAAYEAVNGELPPIILDIAPPIFGLQP